MSSCTVEGFLWHPLSITLDPSNNNILLNDTYVTTSADGCVAEDGEATGLKVFMPPRTPFENPALVESILNTWAKNRHMNIIKKHHAIIDG